METSFENITRRLDLNLATRDTTYDKTRSFGRAIKKLHYTFEIPAIPLMANVGEVGAYLYQFNFVATDDFKILNSDPPNTIFNLGLYCIRYRAGSIVTRYQLPMTSNTIALALNEKIWAQAAQALPYTNQLIKKNFCIELWSSSFAGAISFAARTITTNRLVNPTSSIDDTFIVMMESAATWNRENLDELMPETLPVQYIPGSAWLTN